MMLISKTIHSGGGGMPCTILRYSFLVTYPKNFLKASSAPIYTNFEVIARAEKTGFLVNIFQKKPKNVFSDYFFKILAEAHKIWPKQGFLSALAKTGIF